MRRNISCAFFGKKWRKKMKQLEKEIIAVNKKEALYG